MVLSFARSAHTSRARRQLLFTMIMARPARDTAVPSRRDAHDLALRPIHEACHAQDAKAQIRIGPHYLGLCCSLFQLTACMHSCLALEPMHGADAEADSPRHLADADALGQLKACALDFLGLGTRSAKLVRTMPASLSNLPSRASLSLMTPSPAPIRWRIMERSNPVIWNSSLPVGVVVSMCC